MTLLRALTAAVIGLCSLSMGCSGTAGDLERTDAPDLDDPMFSSMAGLHGTGGTNKLRPSEFHQYKANLYYAATAALAGFEADDGKWWITSNADNDALLATTAGRNTLKYAVRCALSTTTTVHAHSPAGDVSFTGQGILATTSGWKTAALNIGQIDDLFTCMIAHLNANGVEVPINLSGAHVTNGQTGDDAFDFAEALFAAKVHLADSGPTVDVYVWPMDSVVQCGEYVAGLTDRVCGGDADECGLTVREDRDTECTETDGGWYCDDLSGHPLPALLTRLKSGDTGLLYSDCP